MSTLKSLLPQAFAVSDVHPRPRKRLARCTLDCGFKTSESPALRGFVGGPRTLATAALYLVLKSNGLHHSENLPVKFGFSPKIVPANISKKLPAQVLSQIVFHPVFQLLSQTPHVCFHRRKCVHTRLCSKDRTQRLTRRNRGRFGRGWYHYSRSVPHVHEHSRAGCQNGVLCRFGILAGRCSRRTQKAFGTAMRLCVSLSRGVAAPLGCVICLQLGDVAVFSLCAQYFLNVRGGGGITTLGAFHTVRKPCVAGYQNGKLCRFWGLVGGAPKERREPSGQRCAYARRCPEASRPHWAA